MHSLRISATGHGINYLPEYHASRTGVFARLGLEVRARACHPWTGVLDDLADGSADLVLGGIWVPAMFAGHGRDLVAVGQLNGRFPMAIVTREPVDSFDWSWMTGRTVLVPGVGGTAPYEFTAALMREAHCDPSGVRFVRDLSTQLLRELYENGLGDAMVADPLTATVLRLGGHGFVSCDLADAGGVMPNSVYYVLRERLAELREPVAALLAGVEEAMAALTAGAATDAVRSAEWPGGPADALGEAAAHLAANGTWPGVRIEPGGCERWFSILRERGLAGPAATFEALVDHTALDSAGAPRDESDVASPGSSG
jgi:NitT/TauT family transport system substrate-binding protein